MHGASPAAVTIFQDAAVRPTHDKCAGRVVGEADAEPAVPEDGSAGVHRDIVLNRGRLAADQDFGAVAHNVTAVERAIGPGPRKHRRIQAFKSFEARTIHRARRRGQHPGQRPQGDFRRGRDKHR